MIRVEVELPTLEDALAVRQFAQARRARPRQDAGQQPAHPKEPVDVLTLVSALDASVLPTLVLFADALGSVRSDELLKRAHRVAANFSEAVRLARKTDLAASSEPGLQGRPAPPSAVTFGQP
jgi:hypothetical protein